MTLSQIPGAPTFRSSAVNAVAVIPLLSSQNNGQDDSSTHSTKSFQDLIDILSRSPRSSKGSADDILVVVPNANLTRPGDWKYEETPLKNFHWGHGCQRLSVFDGRPNNSRMAHDRLINHDMTREWIDICPSRRTAALIGVLNMKDVPDEATFKKAEQEWQQWAERYSTPPYEVTAHGRDFERDFVVQRLFVFDSFDESCKVDISKSSLGSSLVAFPPANENSQVMDLHTNEVINGLSVSIFRALEDRIRESDAITRGAEDGQPIAASTARARFSFQQGTKSQSDNAGEGPKGSSDLSINNIVNVVSPEKLAPARAAPPQSKRPSVMDKLSTASAKGTSSEAQLLTPLDDVWDYSELSPKDAQEMMRREVGRREKFAGDLSLMAGSPLDAYERYTKAAELCKSSTPDPLWYACALEGCAAAHIAMAEAGGFNVDQYLEDSFQLPDDFMACAVTTAADTKAKSLVKQTLPGVVSTLCDEALNVFSRHPQLACFKSELLLKLAWYTAEVEDTHMLCRWGLGDGCYGGDPTDGQRRWETSTSTQLNFLELKNKKGDNVVDRNSLKRLQNFSDYMHRAVSAEGLTPASCADAALLCASMCLRGMRTTGKPTEQERLDRRQTLDRKAAFFAITAAEALSELDEDHSKNDRSRALWLHAAKMFRSESNSSTGGKYGWATLRASILHAIALQGIPESSEEAAVKLLALMSEIKPQKLKFLDSIGSDDGDEGLGGLESMLESNRPEIDKSDDDMETYIGAETVVSAARNARSFVRKQAKEARSRGASFFSAQQGTNSSNLLVVAQSKWADDDILPGRLIPLADSSNLSRDIIAMKSVWSGVNYNSCVTAQKNLMKHVSNLRKDLPATSLVDRRKEKKDALSPIRILSAAIMESEASADLERTKAKNPVDTENSGAMATFFNPYANKDKGAQKVNLIPEGEERYVLVTFENSLSVPLEVPRCQLEFNISDDDKIKAPAMSFVIPGQTRHFKVQFPFIVLLSLGRENASEEAVSPVFQVTGVHITCLSRSFFLRIAGSNGDDAEESRQSPDSLLPESASRYSRRDYNKSKKENLVVKSPALETVPPQPNLNLSFAASPAALDQNTIIPAPICDGEVFTIPTFYVKNDSGAKGLGLIDHLRITAHDIPGYSEVVLFDSSGNMESSEKSKKKDAGYKPLTLTAACKGLDNDSLNSGNKSSSSISLTLTAAYDMGAHIDGCNIRVRFRYRGVPASPVQEFWRKQEISLSVVRIKGPRISSLTFRPDLSWESSYSDLCKSLSRQSNAKRIARTNTIDLPQAGSTDEEEFVANRIGLDPGIHVCGDKVIVFLSVANETNSVVTLSSKSQGLVGEENDNPQLFQVSPGVSAKVAMVLPRAERSPGVTDHLLSLTEMEWVTNRDNEDAEQVATGGAMVPVNRRIRRGKLRIPAGCLKSIIDENPTFLSRICKAPCQIHLSLDGSDLNQQLKIEPGKPIEVSLEVAIADWLPASALRNSHVILEFCCARKGKPGDQEGNRDFVWVGQTRKSLPNGSEERIYKHNGRILFLTEGHYVVSACIHIFNNESEEDIKETWWAEKAQHVDVKDILPAQ